ncbi:DsrE family protein [Poritiphilus flavus]|uniref:Uncharacterized protein n=1 Tax=Poritiphilus flavus TaxID=2697053 RepID=A0A6L9EF35_9FLAO|nr:DsrE family protein [Poritiphilus flavus]NAS13108.1 hypothetical protein [Poritiphilus flavus]
MKKPSFCFILLFLFVSLSNVHAQTKQAGPVIKEYGAVWPIDQPTFKTDTTKVFKAVFDVMDSPDDPKTLNAKIATVARFLNMHAQHGVPAKNLKAVLVIHNKASKDILDNKAYRSRYQTDNPNSGMIRELLDSGVDIIFCGQSSLSRNIPVSETVSGVDLALSAMTALIQLQDEGYRLIKF